MIKFNSKKTIIYAFISVFLVIILAFFIFFYPELVFRHASTNRNHYSNLDDSSFANFRKIETSGMGNCLFRTSSPIDTELKRNEIVDNLLKTNEITTILNLCDTPEEAKKQQGYNNSYYSTITIIYVDYNLTQDSPTGRQTLANGLKQLCSSPFKCAIHCHIGRDRTGFVCAILESLMGATLDEIKDDYMQSYINLNDVKKDGIKYNELKTKIITKLEDSFNSKITDSNLQSLANSYLLSLGLTQNEINTLKTNLAS